MKFSIGNVIVDTEDSRSGKVAVLQKDQKDHQKDQKDDQKDEAVSFFQLFFLESSYFRQFVAGNCVDF
jgi:hypothetical protein